MLPKILVGCPTSEHKAYCWDRYVEGVRALTYKNFDVLIVDNSEKDDYYNSIKKDLPAIKSKYHERARDRIIEARNVLRQKVLDGNYDYFFSLEQDVIPPKDVIERLLGHNKQIISGVYFNRRAVGGVMKFCPLLWIESDEGETMVRSMPDSMVWQDQLTEIKACGLGCVLIHRDVLKKVKFRYDPNKVAFDDMHFSKDCIIEHKFKIYADTGIKCMHLVKDWNWENILK